MTTVGLGHGHAQTIMELSNQPSARGYAPEDLRLLHCVYARMVPLYNLGDDVVALAA